MVRRQFLTRPSPNTVRSNLQLTRTHSVEDANVLRKVGEYNRVYGAPASVADVAYEQGASEALDEKIIGVIKKRQRRTKRSVNRLVTAGLLVRTAKGGYVLTRDGERLVGRRTLAEDKRKALKEYGRIET